MPAVLAALLLSTPAFAQAPPQSGFDAHGFKLAAHDADARDPLVVARPGRFFEQSWFASGLFEYASQPLIYETDDGTEIELDNLVAANLSLGYAPHDRVRLDLSAPLFFYGEGRDGPVGAGLGDIRATALIALVAPDEKDGGLGLGFLVQADVPTGRPDVYLGQYTIAGGVGVAATYEAERLTLSATASSQLRPNTDPDDRPAATRGGDAFGWGGAVGYLVGDSTGVSVEIHGEVPVDPTVQTAIGVPVEALLSFKHVRDNGGFLTAGLGTGLSRGAGASPLRLLVGGGFGQVDAPFRDLDLDGIPDDEDACPEVPETVNGFKDEDGCRDSLPKLEVRAVGPKGRVLDGALLSAKGPIEVEGIGALVLEGANVMPGSEWALEGAQGRCLAGSSSVVLGERGTAVELQLQTVREGRLMVEVVDEEGKPIEGATVGVRTAEKACFPKAPTDLEGGSGEVALGEGSYRAFVRAPEYNIHTEAFELEKGGQHTIRATLKTTKVRVEAEKIVILEKVFFDTGKATIQERSFELLDEVANVVLANDIAQIEVQGHTDDRGPEDMNQKLSQDRADAVRNYLLEKGVAENQLVAKGYGEAEPIDDNKKKSGRAKNRRVEFKILQQTAEDAPETDAPQDDAPPDDATPDEPAEDGEKAPLTRPDPEGETDEKAETDEAPE